MKDLRDLTDSSDQWAWAIEDIEASFAHVERTIGVQYIAPAAPGTARTTA